MTWRKKSSDRIYRKKIKEGLLDHGCRLCIKKALKEYKYWRIVENSFPWDNIAKTHHMVIPKRHITIDKLNREEKKEYEIIKENYIQPNYDTIAESTHKNKSIPAHFHLHLLVEKD